MQKIAKTATAAQKIEFILAGEQFQSVQMLVKSAGFDLASLDEKQLDQMISNESAWEKTPITSEIIAYSVATDIQDERKSCAGLVQAQLHTDGYEIPEKAVWKKISIKFDSFCLAGVDEKDFINRIIQFWADSQDLICKTADGEKIPSTAGLSKNKKSWVLQ